MTAPAAPLLDHAEADAEQIDGPKSWLVESTAPRRCSGPKRSSGLAWPLAVLAGADG